MRKNVDIKLPNSLYQVVENQTVEISTSKDRCIQNDELRYCLQEQAKVISARKWLMMVTLQYHLYGLLIGYQKDQ